MRNEFKVLKQFDDGKLLIEHIVYTTAVVDIPTGADGEPLSGVNLSHALNQFVLRKQNENQMPDLESSGVVFTINNGWTDEAFHTAEPDLEAMGASEVTEFPVTYAG